jgi:hypothetical protein
VRLVQFRGRVWFFIEGFGWGENWETTYNTESLMISIIIYPLLLSKAKICRWSLHGLFLTIPSETVEKPFSMVNGWFSGVSWPLLIMRSSIVAHSVRSFFSASHSRISLGTFSTVSPVIEFLHFRSKIQHFKRKSLISSHWRSNVKYCLCLP